MRTVKLDGIKPDALKYCSVAALSISFALPFGLSQIPFQDEVQRRSYDWEDDSEAAKTPTPANVVVELV